MLLFKAPFILKKDTNGAVKHAHSRHSCNTIQVEYDSRIKGFDVPKVAVNKRRFKALENPLYFYVQY